MKKILLLFGLHLLLLHAFHFITYEYFQYSVETGAIWTISASCVFAIVLFFRSFRGYQQSHFMTLVLLLLSGVVIWLAYMILLYLIFATLVAIYGWE